MLRIRFYNRRFTSRAPAAKHPLWRPTCQPPAAPCLTARRRLRAEGLSRHCFRAARGGGGSFFGCLPPRLSYPLTPLSRGEGGTCALRLPSSTSLPRAARQCGPLSSRSRRLPPGKSTSSALAGTRLELHARWPAGAVAARVHRCSKTSTRPFYAPLSRAFSWPRALPRLLQIDVSTSTAMDHPNIPDQRNPWPGRLSDSIDRRLSIEDNRRRYSGSGAEDHRTLGAPSRDCSRERLRPNPDRFRHLVSRSSPVTRLEQAKGRAKPPAPRTLARHERREGRATPDLREEIGRSPTRGAFHRKAVRERGATLRSA